ncbi:MAG: DUF1501 domain-containing protein [Verrucomicrobiaceae bacterium]|nr:DUF1501 domain-containing protein [Verrucomicrobiaceae bacterium]
MSRTTPPISPRLARDLARVTNSLGGAPLSRREALRRSVYGSAGLLLCEPFALRAEPAPPPAGGKAKSVIQIWLWGGPCHIDTFDPKPDAGRDYTGALDGAIETNVSGIRIGQLLPELAKQADKYSLIRSMTHGNNGHETAAYLVQTGRTSERDVFPGLGAVVSYFKGYEAGYSGLVPPYVVLTQPQGRFSEAGFLGPRYKPFATGGDPNAKVFAVEGIVAPGIEEARQRERRKFLGRLNTLGGALPGNAAIQTVVDSETQAYELILGDAGKLFDLGQEKDEIRDLYGRNTFGQSCLMARRLVEKGVPYITINYQGWDTHKQHFQIMNRKLPELDRGLAALLTDLDGRGLLDSTVVWCTGEFGRTPKVANESPWNGGRHHYGKVFSCLIAGGGFHGGHVVGASDAKGEEVSDRPVYPADVIGSIYGQLGIPSDAPLPHPQGTPTKVVPDTSEGVPTGGLLTELV